MRNLPWWILALLATLATAGCSPQTVAPAQVQCYPPPRPHLPTVDAGELWDLIGPHRFTTLRDREGLLVDWALEMEGMLDELCGDPFDE